MTTKDPENSVQNEQFDGNEETRESTEENANRDQAPGESLTTDVTPSSDAVTENIPEKSEPAAGEQSVASGNGDIHSTGETAPEGDASAEADAVKEAVPDDSIEEEGEIASEDSTVQDVVPDDSGAEKAETVSEAPAGKDDVVGDSIKEGKHNVEESKTEAVEETGPDSLSGEKKESIDEPAAADEGEADDDTASDDGESTGDEDEKVNYDEIELPPVDYSGFSRKELVETLALIVENRPPSEIVDDVARIKEFFYRKTKAEFNEKRLNYAKEGGNIEDFRPEPDELEIQIKGILDTWRSRRSDFNRILESEKQDNLRKKLDLIEQIKDLVNREEAINKTFQEFRNLQNEWHATGMVPQSAVKDLWENYHHAVEIFYDYIKINRELRDLDLKKNLESKIALCEKAEELLLEPNPVNAFKLLQEYHNQWREIGPVPHENKNDIWERFREATTKVNKRHHEFFEKQKDEQKRNLDAKTALCEKVEEIASGEILTFADFKEKSDAILECQKLWKTIGFAPKKHNNKIYQRFRAACDTFFEKKRAFFAENKETQVRNLQLKTELCLKAEALQESSDWKETSDMLIKLQKEWKEIGPVPKKYSEKIWKRFRKACDTFFSRKSEYFAGRDTSYEDNLKAKLAIIEELDAFDTGEDPRESFEKLKEIQNRWTEIGYVPFNKKEEIARRYKEALNRQFDRLKLDDEDKNILRYRSKVDSARSNPRAARKVRSEREKFYSKIKQLESDIVLWENNIGFFAKSANADNMIREVEEKIAEARRNIKMLEEKVRLIDNTMSEE
ncbi:MAG: DUF349 domain-containing protein [Bacteroidales bacterium]|nr:DUF349 domain-containing protein [Bacteroidales bacterium]MDD3736567.1 DUF349 domain-containing protein [Bacteroidales bacterium]HNT93432.1 DUF349 domain-containing protein [Bacteroidales bacterium]HOO65872.1 DUF349 domain-containing protein [Bacteroidales bacterium]HPE22100.1 DUF349 domain-containing protein [Bacteroidales bacterium]